MNSKEVVKLAYQVLNDKKGEDIKIIDTRSVLVPADYSIIVGGSNSNQVQAMADNVEEILEKVGCECRQIERYRNANWILINYRDVIIHIFCREDRLSYDLERIWRDEKTFVDVNELQRVRTGNKWQGITKEYFGNY